MLDLKPTVRGVVGVLLFGLAGLVFVPTRVSAQAGGVSAQAARMAEMRRLTLEMDEERARTEAVSLSRPRWITALGVLVGGTGGLLGYATVAEWDYYAGTPAGRAALGTSVGLFSVGVALLTLGWMRLRRGKAERWHHQARERRLFAEREALILELRAADAGAP